MRKICKMKEIEKRFGKPFEEILKELVERHDDDIKGMASELGVSESSMYRYLRDYRAERRWVIPELEPEQEGTRA